MSIPLHDPHTVHQLTFRLGGDVPRTALHPLRGISRHHLRARRDGQLPIQRRKSNSSPHPYNTPNMQLNPSVNAFQRPFTPRLRRLAEMSRRLRLFQSQITALSPPLGIPPLSAIPPFTTVGPRAQNAYDELEDKLKEHERRLAEMNRSWEELGKRKGELEEKRWVLRETAGFFNEVSVDRSSGDWTDRGGS